MGTIIVLLILVIIVVLVIRKMIRDRRAGNVCSCGDKCNSCGNRCDK